MAVSKHEILTELYERKDSHMKRGLYMQMTPPINSTGVITLQEDHLLCEFETFDRLVDDTNELETEIIIGKNHFKADKLPSIDIYNLCDSLWNYINNTYGVTIKKVSLRDDNITFETANSILTCNFTDTCLINTELFSEKHNIYKVFLTKSYKVYDLQLKL